MGMLTPAQSILKAMTELPKQSITTRVAAIHVNDPEKAEILIKEFAEQAKDNYGTCVLGWGQEITDQILNHIKNGK